MCGSCGLVRATLFYQVGDISCKDSMSYFWPCVWWGKQFQPYQIALYGERVTWCTAETGGTFHHYIINPLTATICPNLCNLWKFVSAVSQHLYCLSDKGLTFYGFVLKRFFFSPDHRVTQWWGSGQVRNYKQEFWWHTIYCMCMNSFPESLHLLWM